MSKLHRTKALCGIMAALCLGSCISTTKELDLNKDISFDMQIGSDGVKIPLGSTKKIYVDSLIKKSDDSVLVALDNGLYGFSMNGDIKKVNVDIDAVNINIPSVKDTLEVSFSNPGVETFQVPQKTITPSLGIQSINLDDINAKLPKFESSFKSKTVPGKTVPAALVGQKLPMAISIPVKPDKSPNVSFSYEFPGDLKSIDTVYLGDAGIGQKVELNVDMTGILNFLENPVIAINSLDITFPSIFSLAKDNNVDNYLGSNKVTILGADKNVFHIQDASVNVANLISNNSILPVSFYVEEIYFGGNTEDLGDNKYGISFLDSIQYQLELSISDGTIKQGGDLFVNVNMASQFRLADFSVTTKEKQVELEQKTLPLSFQIDDLDNISRVNEIAFDGQGNKIRLALKDFSFNPFSFSPTSVVTLSFPQELVFDKSQNSIYSQGVEVGNWSSTGNELKIYPGLANGKDIDIEIELDTFKVNQQVVNNSIKIDNGISYSATINVAETSGVSKESLAKLTNKEVRLTTGGTLTVANASVVTSVIDTDIDESASISIDEEVDKALLSVKRIDFKNEPEMVMNLKFKGIPSTIDHLDISELSISFPDFLNVNYKGQDNAISVNGNKLIIKDKSIVQDELRADGQGFTISNVYLEGIEFNAPIDTKNGRLVLDNQEVKIQGNVKVDNQYVNSGDLEDVSIYPTVSFSQIQVKSIVGSVNPKIDPVHEEVEISLGDGIDFLKDEGNIIYLSDPQITVNLTSTVTVPVELDIQLSSKKSNGDFIAQGITHKVPAVLPACDSAQALRNTALIIVRKPRPASVTGDTVYVVVEDLNLLMTTVPDKILFDLEAKAVEAEHYVDLSRELSVSGKYDVSIPLSFDDVFLEYSDSFKDLGKDLDDIGEQIGETEIQLLADVFTTIPLKVGIVAQPIDRNGAIIKDIKISSTVIEAGTEQGIVSPFKLTMTVGKGALARLDGISFTAQCVNDPAVNSQIKEGQYIELTNVKLFLPHGVSVDFTDKINNKNK